MRLFGADPEELRLTTRKLYETQLELAVLKANSDAAGIERDLLKSEVAALKKENVEMKKALLDAASKNAEPSEPANPFAGWPPSVVRQIDFARMGMEEPK